jgi:N-acetylmuramoyl-L-alanine amidase
MAVRRVSLVLALAAFFALPAAPTASSRSEYERALAKYENLRLDGPRPTPLSQMRRAVADYEDIARRYPTSGYADNALFQAATIAKAAHRVYESEVDRQAAVRLLNWLVRAYPSSSLRTRAQKLLRDGAVRAERATPRSEPLDQSTTTQPRVSPASTGMLSVSAPAAGVVPTPSPGSGQLVSLRDVHRELVGSLVRVTLVFDGEVAYRHDVLKNPSRLYFDLQRAAVAPALQDATLAFDGPGPRHVRLGRPRGETTRLVIDLEGMQTYSVFALYNPYRLTIDMVPAPPAALLARASAAPAVPMTMSNTAAALAMPLAPLPSAPALSARAPLPTMAKRLAVPASKPITALTRAEPPQLSPRPLPHPLSDRPLRASAGVKPRAIAANLVPLLPARRPLARSVPAYAAVKPRAVAAPVAEWLAAERKRLAPPPLAKRTTTPPSLPAPTAPVPNALGGFSMARQLGLTVSRIVIDPGHGGHDPGTMGNKTTEAEVVLDVALRLEKLLQSEPGFEVVMTRRTDVFVPLEERPAMANRQGADLFLSIHANSSRNKQASGIETYFLNFADNAEAEAVAARENATASRSMHHLPDMVKAIALNNKLDESQDFARKVHDTLVDGLRRQSREVRDRGVKQAPFVVLIGAGMPSVLAEIAFISNPDEGGLLKTDHYRQEIAQALFEAVRKYQRSLKTGEVASQ